MFALAPTKISWPTCQCTFCRHRSKTEVVQTDFGKHMYHKTNSLTTLTEGELRSSCGQQHCNLGRRFLTAPHPATLEVHSTPFTRCGEAAEMWSQNRPCQMNGCRPSSMKQLLYIPISLDPSPVCCWSASCVFTHTSFKRLGCANPSQQDGSASMHRQFQVSQNETSFCVCRSGGRFVTGRNHIIPHNSSNTVIDCISTSFLF